MLVHSYSRFCLLDQDPREYFDSQQANAIKTLGDTLAGTRQIKCSLSTSEAYGSLRERISEVKISGLSDPIVKPEVAFKVLTNFVENHHHAFICRICRYDRPIIANEKAYC